MRVVTFSPFNSFDYLNTVELCHAYIRVVGDDFQKLTEKYDDALQRINDLQAEIEALKIICRDAS
jgi:hypothetical protein